MDVNRLEELKFEIVKEFDQVEKELRMCPEHYEDVAIHLICNRVGRVLDRFDRSKQLKEEAKKHTAPEGSL